MMTSGRGVGGGDRHFYWLLALAASLLTVQVLRLQSLGGLEGLRMVVCKSHKNTGRKQLEEERISFGLQLKRVQSIVTAGV